MIPALTSLTLLGTAFRAGLSPVLHSWSRILPDTPSRHHHKYRLRHRRELVPGNQNLRRYHLDNHRPTGKATPQ